MIDVPEVVRNKARATGASGWLEELPALVAHLEAAWGITVGRTYEEGTEAYVAEATLDDGTPAVLKLLVPRDHDVAQHELAALRLAAGDGCVRLLREDAERGAMLLERLGRSLHQLDLPLALRLEILCATAEQIWRPAPESGLPTGAAKGRWLIESMTAGWTKLDRPCSEAAVEQAVACAERRIAAHDDERAVLVHGDVHQWNALESGRGFTLVDPDGLLAEAEYDLGILMREDPIELMVDDPQERARWLADRTGLDANAIWEWGVVERVSTGLVCLEVGLQLEGGQMLAAADHVAAMRD